MRKFLAFAIVLMASVAFCLAQDTEYGLGFISHPRPSSEWTSLVLNGGEGIAAGRKDMTLEFSIYTRPGSPFGNIVKIIPAHGDDIDLKHSFSDPSFSLSLGIGEMMSEISDSVALGGWADVRIVVSSSRSEVEVDYCGRHKKIPCEGIKGSNSYVIAFGHCPIPGHANPDVPSMAIRDVRVYLAGKLRCEWPLSLHDGDISYGNIDGEIARAENPDWLTDRRLTFSEIFSSELPALTSVAFDGDSIFNISCSPDILYSFNMSDRSLSRLPVNGVYPANGPDETVFHDGKLFVYNVEEGKYSFYDENGRKWSPGNVKPAMGHDMWNKTASYSRERGCLYIFGGYGHFRYNNTLTVVDPATRSVRGTVILDEIDPRFFAASCVAGDFLYIFGGYGDKTGRQDFSPHNYYDLYEVSLDTFSVRKLWDCPEGFGTHFHPGSNLVYDEEKQCFYGIADINGGCLFKIGLSNPEFELMSLPCNFNGGTRYEFRNLYYSRPLGKLVAVGCFSDTRGRTELKMAQMDYPPCPVPALSSPEQEESKGHTVLLVAGLIAAATGFCAFMYARRKKSQSSYKEKSRREESGEVYAVETAARKKASINFFGGFCAFDKDGNDITDMFTPTLKNLVVLLILHSCKQKNGIISGRINTTLWSYKDEESANNNRNVYMSKLRAVLDRIGDIKVVNVNKFWKIEFNGDTSCDYVDANRLLSMDPDRESVGELLPLLLKGAMLPNMEIDWVDEFKSEFSNATVDFLVRQLAIHSGEDSLVLAIADTIFQYDYLNEEAMSAKCRALYRQGKAGLAKSLYDSFCKDYKNDIGLDYVRQFKDIVTV